MKKHVGLSVYVEINGELHVALQRRGLYDHENGFGLEVWAGGCQPLVHGGMESHESDPFEALKREGGEEVGREFMIEAVKYPTKLEDTEEAFFMATKMAIESLNLIRWHVSSGGLALLTEEELVKCKDLSCLEREKPVLSNVIAMFPHDLKFVKMGFDLYRK